MREAVSKSGWRKHGHAVPKNGVWRESTALFNGAPLFLRREVYGFG